MAEGQRRLGALLVEMRVLDEAQLSLALEVQRRSGRRLGKVLVEQGAIDEGTLFGALSRQLRIDLWEPSSLPTRSSARALVAREAAFRARCLPLVRVEEGDSDVLVMATSDPLAPSAAKLVRALDERGVAVRWLLAPDGALERALDSAYGPDRARSRPSVVEVVKGRPDSPVPQPSHDRGAPRRSGAVPAIELSGATETGHTLLADDAVLEVVDDAPALGSLIRETPELHAGAPSGSEGMGSLALTTWGEIVSEGTPDEQALSRALDAATNGSSADPPQVDGGPDDRGPPGSSDEDGGPEAEPDAWSDRSESEERDGGWTQEGAVALARLAIRRADGGVREVVRPRRTHDPRKDRSMPSIPADSLADLAVLTPVPHVGPNGRVQPPRACEDGAEGPTERLGAGSTGRPPDPSDHPPEGRAHRKASQRVDGTVGIPVERAYGSSADAHPEPSVERSAHVATPIDETEGEDPGSTLSVPVLRPPPPAAPTSRDAAASADAPPESVTSEPTAPVRSEPTSWQREEHRVGDPASTGGDDARPLDAPTDPSNEAPTQTLDVSHLDPEVLVGPSAGSAGALEHLSSDLAPPPAAADDDDDIRERAAELHARLIRFAAGESLPETLREDALRVVVDVLLDAGFLEEPAIAKALGAASSRSSSGG